MRKIGFIGLGAMGLPMAVNLIKGGYAVTGMDPNKGQMDRLVAAGGSVTPSIAEAVADADVVVTMLPDNQLALEIYLRPNGIIANAKRGALLIDCSTIDVESARRTEMYELILQRFGRDRVTCVSMMDTYKARHAIRDVGAALGVPPAEVDEIAKAFPHIRAKDVRSAMAELPELRTRSLDGGRLTTLFDLVERLDGLPRHIALHPCGVVLSDGGLLDRTPVESSWLGFPMSQFDKDDVEALGLLKLDVLGIRMQSAMAHAVGEVERVTGERVDLVCAHEDGIERVAEDFRLVPFDMPRGSLAGYYPELNVLVPLSSFGEGSDTPTSKSVLVRVRARSAAARAA